MTDQDFINNGFKQYPTTDIDHKDVETLFQKRYDDDIGKRYFITVKKWRGWTHPYTGEHFPPSYEYETQFYKRNTHEALDLLFHSQWKLEDVEDYLKKLFNTGLFFIIILFDDDSLTLLTIYGL